MSDWVIIYLESTAKDSCSKLGSNLVPDLNSVDKIARFGIYWHFIKKKLEHSCFAVNIAKLLRAPILKNICERLLL